MNEEFKIQCESCGTLYSDLEEVCPYCGEPHPMLVDDHPTWDEMDYEDDLPLAEDDEDQADPWTDQAYAVTDPLPAYEYLPAVDEDGYFQDEYPNLEREFFVTDDFARTNVEDQYGAYEGYEEQLDQYADYDDHENEPELVAKVQSRRFTWGRSLLGCLGTLICIVSLYGSIGIIAAYHGLQEQVSLTQAEAELHYQRGQDHLANDSLELAIAEFELAVSLSPNFLDAREALREARRIVQSQPTPTSETRSAAAAAVLDEAEIQMEQENWSEAIQTLAQVRDLDADYQAEQISELLYQANYELGLQLITPDRLEEALLAFEHALAERPDDPEATLQQTKASLYLEGRAAEETDRQEAVKVFSQLYEEDANYLDIKERLFNAYRLLGDELAEKEEWCLAKAQYTAANRLQPGASLQDKVETSHERCQASPTTAANSAAPQLSAKATPVSASSSPPGGSESPPNPTATTPAVSASTGGGSIFFSAFNSNRLQWEILAVPAGGGSPRVVTINGTMPAVSLDGRSLVYHSELLDAEGFHRLDLATGEDTRITLVQRHILPRWGADNSQFLFTAQEPHTGRWQIYLAFADGKSDPIILRDGRTPDWSPAGNMIAYQGTNAEGNNPGIYLVPFGGGEETRLTTHESDRAPDFSPDGSLLAYMSTQSGNWDIYVISTAGGTPRQLTTAPGQDGLPVWSPDGSQIAYVSDSGGSWAIYAVNVRGGTPVKVAAWDGNNLSDWLLAQIWWTR